MADDRRGSEDKQAGGNFDARLEALRTRHGMNVTAAGDTPAPEAQGKALGVGLRVGVELVSALAVAVAIGWALDRWLHTLPLFLVIFLLLGGAAGVLNVWRTVSPAVTPGRRG